MVNTSRTTEIGTFSTSSHRHQLALHAILFFVDVVSRTKKKGDFPLHYEVTWVLLLLLPPRTINRERSPAIFAFCFVTTDWVYIRDEFYHCVRICSAQNVFSIHSAIDLYPHESCVNKWTFRQSLRVLRYLNHYLTNLFACFSLITDM